ncbi:unannotated protein [freshwater metagenome]|uniref:Unannotated protein n=1 Tax=freshwater metagenome TaxID=449393 RepID=A0A6J6D943_9ZZZZ
MKDEVEGLVTGAELGGNRILQLFQQFGLQFDVAGLVNAVHVSERHGSHVATVFTQAQCFHSGESVFGGRVQVFVDVVTDAIFFTADNTDFNLENRVDRLGQGEHFFCDLKVFLERHCRAVPHVRLEDRVAAGLDLFLAGGDERANEVVERVLRAVVGVQGNRDGVALRHLVRELRERQCAGSTRFYGVSGKVVSATGGHLNDAVGTCLGETLQHGVERLRARNVEGRVRESALLSVVEHLCVLVRCCDGHVMLLGRLRTSGAKKSGCAFTRETLPA